MDRPKSVVRVVRGVAWTVHVSCLSCASSGMYRIWYLRIFDYDSVSWCATGLARERAWSLSSSCADFSRRGVCCPYQDTWNAIFGRPKIQAAAHLSLPYDHCPVTPDSQVQLTQQQLETEMKWKRGGTDNMSHGINSPYKKNPKNQRERQPRQRGSRGPTFFRGETLSFLGGECPT